VRVQKRKQRASALWRKTLIEIESLTGGAASRRLSLSPRMCEERGF
jgi:hypothetical protein